MIPGAAQNHTAPEIMTLAEAAAYLRLSKSTLVPAKRHSKAPDTWNRVRFDF
jgi:hypothetical protein